MSNNTTTQTRKGTPDFQLLILTLLMVGFGLVMVFSSSSSIAIVNKNFNFDAMYFTKKQMIFGVLGLLSMLVTMNIPYAKYKKLFVPVFIVTLIMLLLVPYIGKNINGARSWFGIGSFGVQPSELAKVTIILYLAALISKKGERFRDLRTGYIPVMLIVGFVGGLIMLQPDFGSCVILVATAGLVIFAGGANLKHILGSIALLILGVSIVLGAKFLLDKISPGDDAGTQTQSYKIGRFEAYLDPLKDPQDVSYNLVHSLIAIGHGGVTGTGFGQSVQKLHYLPNSYNDFIFSVIGEEFGFIGTLLFLLFYIYFIWRGILVSLRCPDNFGTLVGVGIMGLIAIQAFINIGGVTNTIPITGVTLPFISYGGSSLMVMMASMGIVLSISRQSSLPVSQERTKSVVIKQAVSDRPARRSFR
ncbi:putative lipid II flippase FtsW [Paenibacillus sp. YPG26]|uniref:putative lipid II flippase FtsW n=1 Tax=Paenibacillus sp. YPG26 TaxID=2878915 RepID=UPI0020423E32|nr:putative lipid II flippase FtsW [Paenibacillus sp. YPG26]USB34591.1 putative lipid II flippase FtsW [Paenibacillus sp. YPG26]